MRVDAGFAAMPRHRYVVCWGYDPQWAAGAAEGDLGNRLIRIVAARPAA
jgi:hypothetical protein